MIVIPNLIRELKGEYMSKKKILSLAAIFVFGCALMLSASIAKKYRTKIEWDGNQYNLENVNPVDAALARPYNKTLDDIGDAFVVLLLGGSGVFIVMSFLISKDKSKELVPAIFDCITFGSCFFYSNGIYRLLKTAAGRIRPYMYFANPSTKGIAEGDFYRSWPSGHSANVFIGFGFLLAWYTFRKADSKIKKPVLTVALISCLVTMVLRLLSGNHFLTDVLSGAVIGFAISYSMAVLCNYIYNK